MGDSKKREKKTCGNKRSNESNCKREREKNCIHYFLVCLRELLGPVGGRPFFILVFGVGVKLHESKILCRTTEEGNVV